MTTSGLRGGVVLLAVTVAAGACSGGDTGTRDLAGMPAFCQDVLPRVDAFLSTFEQPSGERYGGTAVVGSIAEMPIGINSLVSTTYEEAQTQSYVSLMTLVGLDEDYDYVPYLAESWEVNDENTALTFHLRDDVYWHDGTPTTAHDVAFTYLRAIDPATGFANTVYWNNYVRSEDGVEVIDDHTVRFHMRPHAEFLSSWQATQIMPAHLLADVAPADLRAHPFNARCPVGNGPFVFESHRQDESWSFVRNPAFPEGLGGPAYLDRYVYRIIPEQTTLLAELLNETVDLFVAPPPDMMSRIESAGYLTTQRFPFRGYDYIGWNERRPTLSDARVRRALTLGTNRDQIVQAIRQGYGEVANTGLPPIHWAFLPGIRDSLQYDPDRAEALLDEAGWLDRDDDGVRENADGVPLEITIKYNSSNQQRGDITQIMQAQLAPLGVAITPESVEWGTMITQITDPARDFDAIVIGWTSDFRYSDRDLFHSNAYDAPYGFSGTRDPEIDRLIEATEATVDRSEALPLWREYQMRLIEVQPYTFLYHVERTAGLTRRLQGAELDARGEWASIRDWWIPADQR
jgi:peptide/nickel transport system substrate-binding protein